MVKYFYVTLVLCPFGGKGQRKTGRTQKIAASFPWAGFKAHTLAGGDVRPVGHSSFAAKRQLPKSCEDF